MRENEFGINFSTVNGSGSATANKTILKAIFKMGIPVSARNIFPSNIQGMATSYEVRVSKKGYTGRLEKCDILIAMNPNTIDSDLEKLNDGGYLLIDKDFKFNKPTSNITIYPMPVEQILKACNMPQNLSIYLANMVYVGILAYIIGIDLEKIEEALDQHFNSRRSAVEPNLNVIQSAFDWAQNNLKLNKKYYLQASDRNEEKILIDGNTAAALGALYGGLQFAAWYPITPATGIAEELNEYIPQLRMDPETGNTTCIVVQAEDELSAIGMVVGAGWAGLRSMTSTSGPGLCLMAEYLGLAYFAEVPIVIWDVQRVGPSTGLPTHTSQGDLSLSYFISHGDKDYVILLPADAGECYEFGWKALNIAEKLQTPVIILSDLELGMNIWMTDKLVYPEEKIERGKVLWEKDLDKLLKKDADTWGRYKDMDGDGIPYRTVPGNLHKKASYFTRGTGHDDYAHYSEDAQDWENNLLRLKRKFEAARKLVPAPVETNLPGSKVGMISYGSPNMPAIEAQDLLKAEGISVDYQRIKALPFTKPVEQFLAAHKSVFVVEANRDGQMKDLLCLNFPQYAGKIDSVARCNGLSLSAEWIVEQISERMQEDRNHDES